MHKRFVEIDLLRTLAIFLMILFHLVFDLHTFYGFPVDPEAELRFIILGNISKYSFLLLVGISFVLSYERSKRSASVWRKFFLRGLCIIVYGLLITLATYLFDATTYVRFGILHLIGVSILLLPLFVRFRELNILIGIFCLWLGQIVQSHFVPTSLLIPLGLRPPDFSSVDYFPLLPWFGVVLIGCGIGSFFYVRSIDHRPKTLDTFLGKPSFSKLSLPGRYSLFLYLIHQPVLMLILFLLYGKPYIG